MSNEDNTSLQDEALAANFGDLTTQSEGTDAVEESWLVHRSDLEFLPKPRREQREAEEAAAKATEAANVPEGEKAEADQSGLEEGELEESGEEDQIGIVMNEPDHEPYEDAEAVDAPEEDGELEESGEEDQIGIVMNGPDHEPYPDAEAVNFPDDRDADEPDNEATSSTLNDEPSTSHQSRLPRSIALTREQSTSKSDSFSRLNDPKSIPRTDEQSTNERIKFFKYKETCVQHNGFIYSKDHNRVIRKDFKEKGWKWWMKCSRTIKGQQTCTAYIWTTGKWQKDDRGKEYQIGIVMNEHDHDPYKVSFQVEEDNENDGTEPGVMPKRAYYQYKDNMVHRDGFAYYAKTKLKNKVWKESMACHRGPKICNGYIWTTGAWETDNLGRVYQRGILKGDHSHNGFEGYEEFVAEEGTYHTVSPMDEKRAPKMNLIVAVDANYGIGWNNDLPWNLPLERKHFLRETTKVQGENKINAVIMGRNSWESIPEKYRPLKNRINVVLSRTMEPLIQDDFVVTKSLDEALKVLSESEQFKDRIETIWIVGGPKVYAEGLTHPRMHKLVITRIEKEFECDVKFPDVDWTKFETNDDYPGTEVKENGVVWRVFSYTRKA